MAILLNLVKKIYLRETFTRECVISDRIALFLSKQNRHQSARIQLNRIHLTTKFCAISRDILRDKNCTIKCVVGLAKLLYQFIVY